VDYKHLALPTVRAKRANTSGIQLTWISLELADYTGKIGKYIFTIAFKE
jgi:hypothetical protein